MRRWNIAVCDDDKAALSILSGALVSAFHTHDIDVNVELFMRPRELLRRMQSCTFDLLFLDIDMPGMDGLTLGRQLRKENNLIDIIFISNREDLVFDALRLNPKGFIRKSRFLHDVSGVIDAYFDARPAKKPTTLLVQSREQIRYLALNEVIYIEGSGKIQLVHVVGKSEPIELHRQMQELETELNPQGFLRIHKGYLVNYRFIRRIGETDVTLTNGEIVPMSRRKSQETKSEYMELMQSGDSLVL